MKCALHTNCNVISIKPDFTSSLDNCDPTHFPLPLDEKMLFAYSTAFKYFPNSYTFIKTNILFPSPQTLPQSM